MTPRNIVHYATGESAAHRPALACSVACLNAMKTGRPTAVSSATNCCVVVAVGSRSPFTACSASPSRTRPERCAAPSTPPWTPGGGSRVTVNSSCSNEPLLLWGKPITVVRRAMRGASDNLSGSKKSAAVLSHAVWIRNPVLKDHRKQREERGERREERREKREKRRERGDNASSVISPSRPTWKLATTSPRPDGCWRSSTPSGPLSNATTSIAPAAKEWERSEAERSGAKWSGAERSGVEHGGSGPRLSQVRASHARAFFFEGLQTVPHSSLRGPKWFGEGRQSSRGAFKPQPRTLRRARDVVWVREPARLLDQLGGRRRERCAREQRGRLVIRRAVVQRA